MSAASIAAMQVGPIYEKVMDDVVMEMVQHVEDEGLDATVLFELRELWAEKLRLHGGGAQLPIPQADGACDSDPSPIVRHRRRAAVTAAAAAASTAMEIMPIPQVDGGGEAAGDVVGINSNEALDSEDDVDSESESEDEANFMICQFDELKHTKHRYKVKLKNLLVEIDGTDHMFQTAIGDFTWGTPKPTLGPRYAATADAASAAAAPTHDDVGLATLLKSEAEFEDDATDFAGELGSVLAASAVDLSKHRSGLVPVIVNVVASVDLGCPIVLRQLAMRAKNVEFKPTRFPAVTIRMREPKVTAQVFSTGALKIKGSQSEQISHQAARNFARIVQQVGFPDVKFSDYKIDQVVGLCDTKFAVRLQMLYERCSAKADYDPERFPGLKYKMGVPKVTLTVFSTGKVMITGAKNREMLYDAFEKLYPDIEACKR